MDKRERCNQDCAERLNKFSHFLDSRVWEKKCAGEQVPGPKDTMVVVHVPAVSKPWSTSDPEQSSPFSHKSFENKAEMTK